MWDISENLYENPSINICATVETIKHGAMKICFYEDEDFLRID